MSDNQTVSPEQAKKPSKNDTDVVTSVRLDLESYTMIEEASRIVFGKKDLSAFLRMSARAEAMNRLGPKAYRELLEKLNRVEKQMKGQGVLPK